MRNKAVTIKKTSLDVSTMLFLSNNTVQNLFIPVRTIHVLQSNPENRGNLKLLPECLLWCNLQPIRCEMKQKD